MTVRQLSFAVGILFVATMISSIVDTTFFQPLLSLSAPAVVQNSAGIGIGIFLELFLVVGVIGISVFAYPIVRQTHPVTAVFYVVLRSIESVFYVFGILLALSVVWASQQPDPQVFSVVQNYAVALRLQGFHAAMIVLGFNSLLFCTALFRSAAVGRWIAVLGLVGYALLFVVSTIALFDLAEISGILGWFYLPGGAFELIALPIYLFWKGFAVGERKRTA